MMKNESMYSPKDEVWVNEFTEKSAQAFREQMLNKARNTDPNAPIIIFIDSYGGYVDSLAKMISTMDDVPNPKITVCVGKAMSCGAILLSHGDYRFCDKHSRVMIHEVSHGTSGDVHDVHADATEGKRLNAHFLGLLAKNCGFENGYSDLRKLIKERDGREIYLSSQAAVNFGIVDAVGTPEIITSVQYQIGTRNVQRYQVAGGRGTKNVKKTKKRGTNVKRAKRK